MDHGYRYFDIYFYDPNEADKTFLQNAEAPQFKITAVYLIFYIALLLFVYFNTSKISSQCI